MESISSLLVSSECITILDTQFYYFTTTKSAMTTRHTQIWLVNRTSSWITNTSTTNSTQVCNCKMEKGPIVVAMSSPESIDASRSTDSRCLWPLDVRPYTLFVPMAWTWHSIAPKMRDGRHQYLWRWGIKKWWGLHPSTYDCAFIFDTMTELALY